MAIFPVGPGGTSSNPAIVEYSGGSIDTFGRQRVSTPLTIFEVQHQYNTQPLLWNETLVSGATVSHLPNESSVQLNVSTTSGSLARRQTKEYIRYQPGKSQLVLMTGVLGSSKTNVRQRIGYFDNNNGVFFEQISTGIRVVRRSYTSGSPVDTVTEQSSWNLDPMDGSGNSGVTLDTSLSQIFVIDFQWLGVGKIRYGFDTPDGIIYVHEDPNTNELTTPYSTTANLPLTYEIENLSTTASSTSMKQICATVSSEGGFVREGFPFSASNGVTGISVTTRRPILSIRPKSTFNSITNTGLILPREFEVFSDGGNVFYEIVHSGSLTGDSFSSVDANSIVEYDVAATAITGGRIVTSGYVAAGSPGKGSSGEEIGVTSRLPLTGSETLTIVATSIAGPATDTFGIFNWQEIY
jgi:hypothetical protein